MALMRGRTIRAAVAASALAPAIAAAEPRTITITTTTTVTLVPDAEVTDLPPGETAPNAVVTDAAPAPAPAHPWRFTAAGGLAASDEAAVMADLRVALGLTRRLAITGGITAASEADDLGRMDKTIHAETVSLQIWPTSRFWVELGGGPATDGSHDTVLAAAAALGYDVFARPGFAVDAQVRVITNGDDGFAGALVGASWY